MGRPARLSFSRAAHYLRFIVALRQRTLPGQDVNVVVRRKTPHVLFAKDYPPRRSLRRRRRILPSCRGAFAAGESGA